MRLKHQPLVAFVFASLIVTNCFAKSDFDNSDIPRNGARFLGGCGTITKFEQVPNLKPEYTDRRPGQGQIREGANAGDFTQLLSAIPGVGAIAAMVGGAAASIISNMVISNANKQIDESAEAEKKWDKVYLIGIKPDFGPEFTIVYENLNQRDPEIGHRVRMYSDGMVPNGPDQFKLNLARDADFGEPGTDKYFESCYASFPRGSTELLAFRQLVRNDGVFEWKFLDPSIRAAASSYLSKKAAERSQKNIERAEADAMRQNESR